MFRRRRRREQLARALGFKSIAEAEHQLRREHHPGTRMGLTIELARLRHVAGVDLVVHPGYVAAVLTMRWYAWLTFGWLHRRTLVRVKRALHDQVAAAVLTDAFFLP